MNPVKRLFLGVVILIVGLGAAYGYSVSRQERDYRQLIARGDAALAKDDTAAAIESFSGAIALKEHTMLGYLKRGEAYRRRYQLEPGARDAKQLAGLDPSVDSAMRDLRQASELDPLAPRPLELMGDISYSLGRFDKAAERYEEYIKLDDRSPRVLYKLALAQYTSGRFASAVTALQRAVAINDQFAEAYYLLGLCFRDLQRPAESLRALETSVRIASAMLHAREELGDLYGRLGRAGDRIAQLLALQTLDPGPSRQVALGLAYARAGHFDQAVTTLGQAAEKYPDHSYTYVALGRVWLEKTQPHPDRVDLSKALEALEEAIGTDNSSEAMTLFGRALLLTQDVELAERVLQEATEKRPADALAFYYLADAAERRGNAETARRALLDYRALEGDSPDARRRAALAIRIADLSLKLGDAAAAITWYQRGIEADGADAPLLVRVAEAQLQSGDRDAARATVALALEKDPVNRAGRLLARRVR
jgi:tetratricopeptide (TPR) repeat protein